MKKLFLSLALSIYGLAVVSAQFSDTASFKANMICPASVTMGDMNGDGKPDMLINRFGKGWNFKESEIQIYLNKDGNYAGEPDKKIMLPGCYRLAVYDVDQDGKNDIVAVIGRYVCFLLNKDEFDSAKKIEYFNTNQGNNGIWIGNINKKGSFDTLVGPVWRQFTFKDGKFARRNGYVLGPKINDTWVTTVADMDNDGSMDIVGSGRKDNTLRIYYGPLLNVTVNPEELNDFYQLKVPGKLSGFAIGDLNADGLKDLVVTDSVSRKTHIYFQNQPVGFDADAKPSVTINLGGQVYVDDLNNDKLSDLVILNKNCEVILFLQKQGKPLQTELAGADQILKMPPTNQLVFKDVNSDGIKDLISKGSRNHVRIYPGIVKSEPSK